MTPCPPYLTTKFHYHNHRHRITALITKVFAPNSKGGN